MIHRRSVSAPTVAVMILAVFVLIFFYAAYRLQDRRPVLSWQERQKAMRDLKVEMGSASDQIKAQIGSGHCDFDNECRVVGLGANVCKGFGSYLVYSNSNIDENALLQSVKRFNAAASQLIDFSLTINDCGVPAPLVKCAQGRCQALKRN